MRIFLCRKFRASQQGIQVKKFAELSTTQRPLHQHRQTYYLTHRMLYTNMMDIGLKYRCFISNIGIFISCSPNYCWKDMKLWYLMALVLAHDLSLLCKKIADILGHIVIAQWAEVRKNTNLNLKKNSASFWWIYLFLWERSKH